MGRLLSGMMGSLVLLLAMGLGEARAAEGGVTPAIDGIFAAFKDHPLVGLGDAHGLAEEGAFYQRLVADPRFARQVGNVVFEAASASHQHTLDRYLAGEDVPRDEVRKIWSDAVGWATPPAEMYGRFLASVRETNRNLPPALRIKVWAGEPPADWAAIQTIHDLEPYLGQRDTYPAELIRREILAKNKRALVIYGSLHFYPHPALPPYQPAPGLRGLVEAARPGAFYVVQPYFGYMQPDCSTAFEAATRWPPESLIAPVKGMPLQALLLREGCSVAPLPRPAPGAPAVSADTLTRVQAGFLRPISGADADAILYLGPAASLTRSPDDPDLGRDPVYTEEIKKRLRIMGAPPDLMTHLVTKPVPYRNPPAPGSHP